MTQKYLATWPESPKRVRKKILTHAKDTPRSHTKLLSSPSRDLASLGIKICQILNNLLHALAVAALNCCPTTH